MQAYGHAHIPPSTTDGDGVRVMRAPRVLSPSALLLTVLASAVIVAGSAYLLLPTATPAPKVGTAPPDGAAMTQEANIERVAPPDVPVAAARPLSQRTPAPMSASLPGPDALPSGDPDDLASYVSPTDPEPTAGEVIQALHDIGDHTGIGAFNPPGTSPPLQGLAVPEDYILPPGYVRHYQVTDEGEPLEAILMYSPDLAVVEVDGRPMPVPEDRLVPPELAPPGLPIREITIPPKP